MRAQVSLLAAVCVAVLVTAQASSASNGNEVTAPAFAGDSLAPQSFFDAFDDADDTSVDADLDELPFDEVVLRGTVHTRIGEYIAGGHEVLHVLTQENGEQVVVEGFADLFGEDESLIVDRDVQWRVLRTQRRRLASQADQSEYVFFAVDRVLWTELGRVCGGSRACVTSVRKTRKTRRWQKNRGGVTLSIATFCTSRDRGTVLVGDPCGCRRFHYTFVADVTPLAYSIPGRHEGNGRRLTAFNPVGNNSLLVVLVGFYDVLGRPLFPSCDANCVSVSSASDFSASERGGDRACVAAAWCRVVGDGNCCCWVLCGRGECPIFLLVVRAARVTCR